MKLENYLILICLGPIFVGVLAFLFPAMGWSLFDPNAVKLEAYWYIVAVITIFISIYTLILHGLEYYKSYALLRLPRGFITLLSTILLSMLISLPIANLGIGLNGYDRRSESLAIFVENILGMPTKSYLNMMMNKSKLTHEEWKAKYQDRSIPKDEAEQCEYINGIATKDYWLKKTKSRPEGLMQSCTKRDYYTLAEYMEPLVNGSAKDSKISIVMSEDVLKYPRLIEILSDALKEPCNYIPTVDKYEEFIKTEGIMNVSEYDNANDKHIIQQMRKDFKCELKWYEVKEDLVIYFEQKDHSGRKKSMVIKREK